jgi:hypothetical protein
MPGVNMEEFAMLNRHNNALTLSTIPLLIVAIMMGCLWTGCSKLSEFFENAPIEDGLYLSYSYGNGTWVTVEFTEISSDRFYASSKTEYAEEEDGRDITASNAVRVIVDKQLKKENGYPYDADVLGPLWTPPSSIRQGGSIHGTRIDEIKKWKQWNVGVIKASFGRGAVTGQWYYDQKTGFLVGGQLATVMDETGDNFELDDTNLNSLMPQ